MEIVPVNGVEIAYERTGAGPPLVLVHGAVADSRMWGPQLAGLAGDLTVIAWDEPGAGRSSDLPPGFAFADYADCLAGLIAAVVAGPAHVAGLSWGGTLALALADRHPEAVATLILAGAYAGWKGSLPAAEVQARVAGVEAMLAAPDDAFDPTLPGLFAGDPPPEAVPLMAAMAGDVRRESMRTALGLMAETDLNAALPRVAVPTLLIWGELDARSPLAVARRFAAEIADARLVVLPGTGHMANLEQPHAFNAAVRDFCRAHPV